MTRPKGVHLADVWLTPDYSENERKQWESFVIAHPGPIFAKVPFKCGCKKCRLIRVTRKSHRGYTVSDIDRAWAEKGYDECLIK